MATKEVSFDGCLIHCGDPRIVQRFRQFLRERRLLTDATHRMRLFGGAWYLAHGSPEQRAMVLAQIGVSVCLGGQRIVLANHADCVWYASATPGHPNTVDAHAEDIRTACECVRKRFPDVLVLGYVVPIVGARVEEPREIVSHVPARVSANSPQ